jgi:hypothetical protein
MFLVRAYHKAHPSKKLLIDKLGDRSDVSIEIIGVCIYWFAVSVYGVHLKLRIYN